VSGTADVRARTIRSLLAFLGLALSAAAPPRPTVCWGAGWLAKQKPAIYDGLDVPHRSDNPAEVEVHRWLSS
jgi:hypothetical protein